MVELGEASVQLAYKKREREGQQGKQTNANS